MICRVYEEPQVIELNLVPGGILKLLILPLNLVCYLASAGKVSAFFINTTHQKKARSATVQVPPLEIIRKF